MNLSKAILPSLRQNKIAVPDDSLFTLPEKVLQFGTGVLLRGLPDYFIDRANNMGLFNGRVVIVKSTEGGDLDPFNNQDGLYTICVRGIDDGRQISEDIISSSVSRVIAARTNWKQVLELAGSSDLQIVISNTTEVGITLVKESISAHPPESYPAKLLAFLFERYNKLGNHKENGLVIIPTELIVDNGKKLQEILNDLAMHNNLPGDFTEWLNTANTFCSSLVDRIVPGKPSQQIQDELQKKAGYQDELMIMAEVYRLWAIQGDEKVKEILSFAAADPGVIIEPDIDIYRELKLRMLNGTHTFSCGLAVLAGFQTVKEAMVHSDMADYIASLMLDEIDPGIPFRLEPGAASSFGRKVLDRFRNQAIEHKWLSITVQFTSKMKMRNIPVLLKYYEVRQSVPQAMALGFAAYICFMKVQKATDGKYYGEANGFKYLVQDDQAAHLAGLWQQAGEANIVSVVLQDVSLWGTDLTALPGFEMAVTDHLTAINKNGGLATLKDFQQKKMLV